MYDIVIIGGGASGLLTAALLHREGLSVALIESNDRVGKKLLSTGNGKCNLTNHNILPSNYNTLSIAPLLERFTHEQVIEVFMSIGLICRRIGDCYYPYSEQASSVLNALRSAIEGIDLFLSTKAIEIKKVASIYKDDNQDRDICGYSITTDKGELKGHRVVIASGSMATTGLNSLGLMTRLGYQSSEFLPSLLPLLTSGDNIKGMVGVRAKVTATINCGTIGDKKTRECEIKNTHKGEMLFKDNALSGIVSFGLSSELARSGNAECIVSIDFAGDYSLKELTRLIAQYGIEHFFHKSIVSNILSFSKSSTASDIAYSAKNYLVKCKMNRDIKSAQVAHGGLSLEQFDVNTLESKKDKGLYAIGEVVNVDGDCGGYNLHWAWISAMAVAEAVVKGRG